MYLSMRVKSLMGLKISRSWGVDKPISNLQQVRVLLENHAQKSHFVAAEIAVFSTKFAIYTRYVTFWKIMLNFQNLYG